MIIFHFINFVRGKSSQLVFYSLAIVVIFESANRLHPGFILDHNLFGFIINLSAWIGCLGGDSLTWILYWLQLVSHLLFDHFFILTVIIPILLVTLFILSNQLIIIIEIFLSQALKVVHSLHGTTCLNKHLFLLSLVPGIRWVINNSLLLIWD